MASTGYKNKCRNIIYIFFDIKESKTRVKSFDYYMGWKQGKYRTGRTLRSSFSPRNEGILVLKNKRTSVTEETETDEVVYSLGKQNRWMMPDLKSDFTDEGVVLVDRRNFRRTSNYNPNSSMGKDRKIEQGSRDTDMVFEVTYPNYKDGTCKSTKSKKSKHCKMRRHVMTEEDCMLNNDFVYEDYWETDNDGDDVGDDDHSSLTDHSMSLGEYLFESLNKQYKEPHKELQDIFPAKNHKDISTNSTSSCNPEKKVIVVDDEELTKMHKEMYDKARKRNEWLEFIDNISNSYRKKGFGQFVNLQQKGRKKQTFPGKRFSFIDEEQKDPTPKPVTQCNSEDSYEYVPCEVNLLCKDLEMSELRRVWGERYHEGESYPRKFAISLSDSKNSLESAHILFELQSNELYQHANHSHASIKLLINNELSKISEETGQVIIKDFCDVIATCSDAMSIEDVIKKVRMCTENHTKELSTEKKISPSKRCASLQLIERVNGWKGEVYTEEEAFVEIKKEMDGRTKKSENHLDCYNSASVAECGICFEDLKSTDSSGFTMLTSCGHSFCNSCWKMYICTKLRSGQVDLFCPEHSCKVVVDPVTIMSLASAWYEKYFSWKLKRGMVTSPSWKNCPSDQCNLVMKVLPSKDDTSSIPASLPVSCACNSIWCFDCQEQAHWPATCNKANKFRAQNTGYRTSKKGALSNVTSVSVKKCPNCSYPVEKHGGCNYMYCVLCNTEFCWQCVRKFSVEYRHCCSEGEERKARKYELPLLMSDAERVANIAVKSYCIVKAGLTLKTQQQIKSMEKGLEAYSSLKNISKIFHSSSMGSIIDSMIKNNVTDVLRKAYKFELQAHIALEGMSIGAIAGNKPLLDKCMILSYILDKLADILNSPRSLYKDKNIARLNELIELGQTCLTRIR